MANYKSAKVSRTCFFPLFCSVVLKQNIPLNRTVLVESLTYLQEIITIYVAPQYHKVEYIIYKLLLFCKA